MEMTEPPRKTRRPPDAGGPPVTRRAGTAAPAGATGPGPAQPQPIPVELAERFDRITQLPRPGGEADVYRVATGPAEHLLKLYRVGARRPDADVWAVLGEIRSARLPALLDCGVVRGRPFEIWEYVPGGDLTGLAARHPGGMPLTMIESVVDQLAGALAELHAHRIPHRDVKPSNVLVRGEDPLDLLLADFGLAVRLGDRSQLFRSASRTTAYAAPEVFAELISPAGDWWSLGMLVLELASGAHPFAGMSERNAMLQIMTRAVPIPDDLDPRVRCLCQGLLVFSMEDRWKAEQVRLWREGRPPDPPQDREPPPSHHRPLEFNGVGYTEPGTLALSLSVNWAFAVRRFFDPMAEPWADLRVWLEQFDSPGREETSGALADRLERAGLPGDVNLLHLLRWLDPGMPPYYRGEPLELTDLPDLAKRASGQDGKAVRAQRVVESLWQHGLLLDLDSAPHCRGSAEADRRWRRHHDRWTTLAGRLRAAHPEVRTTFEQWTGPRLRAHLLWLATDPAAERWLRGEVDRARRRVGTEMRRAHLRLDWFDEIIAKATDPVGLLAAYAVSAQARAAADRLRRTAGRREQRVREWNRVERWRELDRPVALAWAGAAMGCVLVAWTLLLLLSTAVDVASEPALVHAWIYMGITVALQSGLEFWLAAAIGAPYHPHYSLMLGVARVFRDVGGTFATRGTIGFAVTAAVAAALIAVTLAAPYALPMVLLPAHAGWVHVRYRRWRAEYTRRRARAVGPAALKGTR